VFSQLRVDRALGKHCVRLRRGISTNRITGCFLLATAFNFKIRKAQGDMLSTDSWKANDSHSASISSARISAGWLVSSGFSRSVCPEILRSGQCSFPLRGQVSSMSPGWNVREPSNAGGDALATPPCPPPGSQSPRPEGNKLEWPLHLALGAYSGPLKAPVYTWWIRSRLWHQMWWFFVLLWDRRQTL